jgi:hypothetical protein
MGSKKYVIDVIIDNKNITMKPDFKLIISVLVLSFCRLYLGHWLRH